mmetsp:Transcript_3411/g.14978  ORF Transcript_3411/g.14978 Transcript_3411/m.14978 type:complete len:421 (-) Transcript_3411:98-1360(-)
MEELVHVRGLHDLHRAPPVDHAVLHEVHRDLHGARAGALAAPRLKHVQLTLLHGELDVLHVLVVLLQQLGVSHEIFVRLGQGGFHGEDILGRSDSRDDVLALGVDQVLSVEEVLARGGVAREANPGARGFAHVAEHHGLDVHRGALQASDLVDRHVLLRAVAVPAVKHRVRREAHLLEGLLREHLPFGFVNLLVPLNELPQVLRGELVVLRDAHFLLQRVDLVLEQVVLDAHDHVSVHVQESAVGIKRKLLAGFGGESLGDVVVESEVEHGVHHAGHGDRRAGADGEEQGVGRVAQLLPHALLHEGESLEHLVPAASRELAAVFVERGARLGGDGESRGDGEADSVHLREVGALAAQQGLHGGVAVGLSVAEGEDSLGDGGGLGGSDGAGDHADGADAGVGRARSLAAEGVDRGPGGHGR